MYESPIHAVRCPWNTAWSRGQRLLPVNLRRPVTGSVVCFPRPRHRRQDPGLGSSQNPPGASLSSSSAAPSPAQSSFAASWTVIMTWPDILRQRKRWMNLEKNIFGYLNQQQTVSQEIDHIRAKLKRNQETNDAKLKSSFPPKRQLRKVSTFKMNEFKTARIIRICLNAEIFFLFKICHSCKFLKPALSVQK